MKQNMQVISRKISASFPVLGIAAIAAYVMTVVPPVSAGGSSWLWQVAQAPEQMFVAVTPAERSGMLLVAPPSRAQLLSQFEALEYSLTSIRAGAAVPRLYLRALPSDLEQDTSPAERKLTFLRTMLPLILSENEKILADRHRLQRLSQKVRTKVLLGAGDYDWVLRIAAEYKLPNFNPYSTRPADWKSLLSRVDAVPPSLALAQAAVESGWGTSRFAQHGNAVFGQWAWGEDDGMAPRQREADAEHTVRSFNRLSDSVHAYLRNLNTHGHYEKLRDHRAQLRQAGKTPGGFELARFVDRYSVGGKKYVADLREVIKINTLKPLDGARLRPASEFKLSSL